jgi:hypothetical protein
MNALHEAFPGKPHQPPGTIDLEAAVALAPEEPSVATVPLILFVDAAEREGLGFAIVSAAGKAPTLAIVPQVTRYSTKLEEIENVTRRLLRKRSLSP